MMVFTQKYFVAEHLHNYFQDVMLNDGLELVNMCKSSSQIYVDVRKHSRLKQVRTIT